MSPVDPGRGGPFAGAGGPVPAWHAWSPTAGSCGHEHPTEDAAHHCAQRAPGTGRDAYPLESEDPEVGTERADLSITDSGSSAAATAPGEWPHYLLDSDTDRPVGRSVDREEPDTDVERLERDQELGEQRRRGES